MSANVLTSTTQAQRAALAVAGFVHVTGLTAWGPMEGSKSEVKVENVTDLGRFQSNNGKLVMVTIGGEIWLAMSIEKPYFFAQSELGRELCPRGQGAFVPCSNGEYLHFTDMLARLADPDYDPNRR